MPRPARSTRGPRSPRPAMLGAVKGGERQKHSTDKTRSSPLFFFAVAVLFLFLTWVPLCGAEHRSAEGKRSATMADRASPRQGRRVDASPSAREAQGTAHATA